LVRELHRAKIEVILDVVYGHTAESDDYKVSFRGIDKTSYYHTHPMGMDRNYSGCGNTFQANTAAGSHVILSSLRYWVEEMHVDGFRFDLASILTRGSDGQPLDHPPLLRAIMDDPILSKVKLIAEPWDASGLYQISQFPKRFLTWNDRYRDHVRKFIKGTFNEVGAFATALCGSQPLYASPLSSLNFITAHDGYTLHDLVTYQVKYNLANGENNNDGSNANYSWNCGVEGPTVDQTILKLRERQMRNFFLALLLAQGVPLILMGDEIAHTRQGNNNPYNQDDIINHLQWTSRTRSSFVASLIAFRRANPIFRHSLFLSSEEIQWHGQQPLQPDWSNTSRLVAYTLKPFYIAFNANYQSVMLTLPSGSWHLVLKTDEEEHYLEKPETGPLLPNCVELAPYSAFLAKELP
jgi:isoamylase/glycogen operon protein